MNFHVLTLFPEMIEQGMNTSILGRAMEKQLIHLNVVNIRDFSKNKHHKVDDYPYGGGAGMVMQAEPIYKAYESIVSNMNCEHGESEDTKTEHMESERTESEPMELQHILTEQGKKIRVIYLTPQGKVFNQSIAKDLAKEEELVFLCGHYEGVDERVLELIVTDYISIGDYVLTGGELPAMVVMDAVSRLVPGVLNNDDSAETESFSDSLLEYPQYTRPEVFADQAVPEVLLSGHHGNIEKWRREQSVIRTAKNRPDLLEKAELTQQEKILADKCRNNK